MKLVEALRAERRLRLAIVGAGGKTSTMFALARQFSPPVIIAATAHLALDQVKMADRHFMVNKPKDAERSLSNLRSEEVALFTGPVGQRDRTSGVDYDTMDFLRQAAELRNCPLIIEADGARRLALKAPAAHEPPVPPWVNHVLVVAGLSALGKQLGEKTVFRAEVFSNLSGISIGKPISLEGIVNYLTAPDGGLKNVPASAERSIFFNQADLIDIDYYAWEKYSRRLLSGYQRVLIGSAASQGGLTGDVFLRFEKVTGIVLAAGESSRLGTPKQILPWHGKPLIWHVVTRAIAAGLDAVVVVVGAITDEIYHALEGLDIQIVNNTDWKTGQSSSIKAGLRNLTDPGAAVFFTSDKPQVDPELVRALVAVHRREGVKIIGPRVNDQRTNPVLFDRDCFHDLLNLKGDTGGRMLFEKFPVRWVAWHDSDLLLDIDTIDDYDNLLRMKSNQDKNEPKD